MAKAGQNERQGTHEPADALAAFGWSGLFESLTRVDPASLDRFLVHDEALPEQLSARGIRDRVAGFLGIRKGDADELLGTSSSRLSRNDRVDVDGLDRTYALTRVVERVAAVVGTERARLWLREPNPGLEGEIPLELLQTRYGGERVENLVEALLHGAVV